MAATGASTDTTTSASYPTSCRSDSDFSGDEWNHQPSTITPIYDQTRDFNFSPAWARHDGLPPAGTSQWDSAQPYGARPRTTISIQQNEVQPPPHARNDAAAPHPAPWNDPAVGQQIIAGVTGAMSGVMQDFSKSVCGAIQGMQQNLEQTNKGLYREMTATAPHAPLLDTIDRFEAAHPPPPGLHDQQQQQHFNTCA
jgi:hypothetical protein